MLKLLRYLKRSSLAVLAVLGLLIVQASCDLALPSYTSRIVNVGIQQEGVEHAAPEAILAQTLDTYRVLLNQSDMALIDRTYTLLSRDTLDEKSFATACKRYPALSDQPVYERRANNDTLSALDSVFAHMLTIVNLFESDSPQAVAMREKMPLPAGVDPLSAIAQFPDAMRTPFLNKIAEQLSVMPDSLLIQSAIPQTRAVLAAVGMDVAHKQSQFILLAGLQMLGLALLSMVATILVGLLSARTAARMGRDLRADVFNRVVSFSSNEMDHFSTASLITRSTNDIQQIQMLLVMMLRVVFYAPIMGVGGVIKVLGTNTHMAWIIAVAVMAILMLVLILFGIAMPKFQSMQKLVDRLNLVTREILTGLQVIRAFSTQDHEVQRFDNANRDLTHTMLFVNRVMAIMMPTMMLIMNGVSILIVWNGAHGVESGAMQVGDMMAFIQYTMQIIMSFLMISMLSIMLPRASVSAQRIDEVLKTQETITDPAQPQSFDPTQRGVVRFEDVSFRYPGAQADVLSHIDFIANPGQTTAIIGSTGSGKSTLMHLIPRFYDVTQGCIRVNGVDIRQVTQHDLRARLGLIPQKGVLFSGTIASNIGYGQEHPVEQTLRTAAEVAQADDFIREKEEGYESPITQGGANVSGGQKQRLSIARAIAKAPDIYLFDDSFSALDYQTDVALRKALHQHTADSTVIIIAQRISTILHADQILVLDEGRIVGKGTHASLLESCAVYQQIAASQLSKEELAQ